MKKSKIIILKKKEWDLIASTTLQNIVSLLDATRTLIDNIAVDEDETKYFSITTIESNPTVAAGLFTFAVEEYGKYLYLKSLEQIDEKYHIDYDNEFKNHDRKFKRALSNLPNECKLVNLGEKEDTEFYEPDFHDDIIANFETRTRIFYSDFDHDFADIVPKFEPPVSTKLLKIGVKKLWEIVDSERTKLMTENKK